MNDEYTPTERAFVLGLRMATERRIDNSQLAATFGLSPSGAYRLMIRLARVAPIVRDGRDWRLLRAHTCEAPMPAAGLPGVDE